MRQTKLDIVETHLVRQRSLVVGIDVSKKSLSACACTPERLLLGRACFANSGPGYRALLAWIKRLKRENGFRLALVGMEPTGSYSKPLQRFLFSRGVTCVQVNPAHVKKTKDLEDNSPDKNDKKDPLIIADLVRQGKFLTVLVPTGVIAGLRECVRGRERIVTMRTQLINQLESVVFEAFPEFFSVFRDLTTRTAQAVLAHCPTPQAIRSLGLEGLTQLVRKASRGRSGREVAEALVAVAEESVGIWEAEPEYRQQLSFLLQLIATLDEFIRGQERHMRGLLKRVPYAAFILSIPGVGVVTTAAILSELGDLQRYRSPQEVLKQAGLNLYQLSSGGHRGRARISRRGSALLRKYLYLAAMAVVNSRNCVYREFYRSYTARAGKSKALTAVMRKLLVLAFTLARKEQNYQRSVSVASA